MPKSGPLQGSFRMPRSWAMGCRGRKPEHTHTAAMSCLPLKTQHRHDIVAGIERYRFIGPEAPWGPCMRRSSDSEPSCRPQASSVHLSECAATRPKAAGGAESEFSRQCRNRRPRSHNTIFSRFRAPAMTGRDSVPDSDAGVKSTTRPGQALGGVRRSPQAQEAEPDPSKPQAKIPNGMPCLVVLVRRHVPTTA